MTVGGEIEYASSLRDLGRRLGVSASAVRKWAVKSEWTFGKSPPFNVGAVREWRAVVIFGAMLDTDSPATGAKPSVGAGDPGSNDDGSIDVLAELRKSPIMRARLAKLIEQTAAIKLDRSIKEGQYVRLANIRRAAIANIHEIKTVLLSLPRLAGTIAQRVELGKQDERVIEQLIDRRVRAILEQFARGQPGVSTQEAARAIEQKSTE